MGRWGTHNDPLLGNHNKHLFFFFFQKKEKKEKTRERLKPWPQKMVKTPGLNDFVDFLNFLQSSLHVSSASLKNVFFLLTFFPFLFLFFVFLFISFVFRKVYCIFVGYVGPSASENGKGWEHPKERIIVVRENGKVAFVVGIHRFNNFNHFLQHRV